MNNKVKILISWLKSLTGWKKILSRIVIIIIFLYLLSGFVWLIMFLNRSIEASKFKKHLISVGYNCEGDWCYRVKNNKKETIWVASGYGLHISIHYDIEVENEYSYTIKSEDYEKNKAKSLNNSNIISVSDKRYKESYCDYIPKSYMKEDVILTDAKIQEIINEFASSGYPWHIGESVYKLNDCKRDLTSNIESSLREFESYFSSAGLKLK